MSAASDAAPQDPRALARRRRLSVAAAITLAASVWAALLPDETPPAAERQRPNAGLRPARARADGAAPTASEAATTAMPTTTARASATPSSWPEAPRIDDRRPWPAGVTQGVAAWSVAAAPPLPPTPPAPAPARIAPIAAQPQAPAFPYVLIGRLDDGEPRALLSGPVRSFGVKAADVIDGQWRVDAVAAQGLTLTWLPGSLKKTLTFGAL